MGKIAMQVLSAPGCIHCHDFLKFWNTESLLWKNVSLHEIDILSEEGQHLVSKFKIFALPGIIVEGTLISSGAPDIEKLRSVLAKLST